MKKIFTSSLIIFAFHFSMFAQATFQKVITVANHPEFVLTSTHANSDGTFLACGNGNTTNGFVMKLDAGLQVVWVKEFDNVNGLSVFNVGECIGGGYFANGYSYDYNNGCEASFLVKLDVSGNNIWSKQFDMAQGELIYGNVAPKAKQLSNGDFLITTAMYSSMGVIRTDANGNIIFAKSFRGDSLEWKDPGLDGVICNDGGILCCGKRGNDPYFVKTDATGNVQWSKMFSQTNFYDRIYRVIPNADGSFYVTGMRYNLDSANSGPYPLSGFLMKMDGSGNILWYKEYAHYNPNPEDMHFLDMKVLSSGNLLLLGLDVTTYQTIIIITDANGIVQSSRIIGTQILNGYPYHFYSGFEVSSTDDVLLGYAVYDYNTNITSSYLFNSAGLNFNWCDANYFPVTTNFPIYNPSVSSGAMMTPLTLSSTAFAGPITASASVSDYCLTSGINVANENSAEVYPNPFSTSATIKLNASAIDNSTNFILYDVLGNEVQEIKIVGETTSVEKGNLSAGIYLYKIVSERGIIGKGKIILKD